MKCRPQLITRGVRQNDEKLAFSQLWLGAK